VLGTKICIMGVNKSHPIRFSRYCSNYISYDLNDLIEEKEEIIA